MQPSDIDKKVKGYRRLIPSMTALLEFEAVARLASFTLAAQELGVTQAAVSKQIRLLEDTLQTKLFHRLHRSIKLTHEGYVLHLVVAESIHRMASVFDKIAEGIGEQEITIACTEAFSHLRILPRLIALRTLQPKLKLRLLTQQVSPSSYRDDVDLAIRFGNGKWEDGSAIFLFDEEVFPVCAPAWLAANAAPSSVTDFLDTALIDSDSTLEGWMTWNRWCRELGDMRPKLNYSFRCSSYNDAIEAAIQGHGIALGWSRLIAHRLNSGELIRITPYVVKPKDAYYLVIPSGRKPEPITQALIDWLCDDSHRNH
ncbi:MULTISPECIES: LysR substrate-binding domain-containing protein [unclassified Pseudomonas]|uniref:LysR substrate-binding domain-containing protein n=1 Tax=unclassified Pseudomonas TaxID=196821 RepID=UPI0008713BF2|nr:MULTISPECIES: LysR substrate-binding domain-containing protein [unclassified Pseudomonas]SCW55689.1 DNA-binding transcriptional regulator, LysR family [Pseudomonas sp. NFACC56-3]SFK29884.1 DNA-binding transcriptional regulator, LysR family [Pseudomonas sp. NFACC52]